MVSSTLIGGEDESIQNKRGSCPTFWEFCGITNRWFSKRVGHLAQSNYIRLRVFWAPAKCHPSPASTAWSALAASRATPPSCSHRDRVAPFFLPKCHQYPLLLDLAYWLKCLWCLGQWFVYSRQPLTLRRAASKRGAVFYSGQACYLHCSVRWQGQGYRYPYFGTYFYLRIQRSTGWQRRFATAGTSR